ncbi:hypothetical protein SEA_GUEY18_118 [Gordonia phage Guey18]|nr:hypothetical protein SEA_GUEY18_118 [Gordonia phage Guey18]
MRQKPNEQCVDDEELEWLDSLPIGTVVRNGSNNPNYFVKIQEGWWSPCYWTGKPYSDREPSEWLDNPLWLGPHPTDHLHKGFEIHREKGIE